MNLPKTPNPPPTQHALIERLADLAWPAAYSEVLGPWKLRATQGVTRRANSVLTLADPNNPLSPTALDKLIDSAEGFFKQRDLTPCFQISPQSAPGLDRLLDLRGYTVSGMSEVWTAPRRSIDGGADILVCPEEPSNHPLASTLPITLSESPSRDWFNCAFDDPPDRRTIHEDIVRRIPTPRAFASALDCGVTAGCGMVVAAPDHSLAGIFCMNTRPESRRMGIAGAILKSLSTWAASQGATTLYLQVMNDNAPARSLYTHWGFSKAFPYHYRVRY